MVIQRYLEVVGVTHGISGVLPAVANIYYIDVITSSIYDLHYK